MSCRRPPIARSRSRSGAEPELVADLRRAQRDPARVLLRVRVLLGELDEERADVRAEERLLLGDEVGALEIAEQRPRARDSAAQVVRDGEAHGGDPDDLEAVTEPPAEIPEVEEKSCRKGHGEPRDADGNEQIRTTLREPIGAQRTPEEHGVEREPGAQHDPGRGAPRLRNRRHQPGLGDRREPRPKMKTTPAASSQSSGLTAAGLRTAESAPSARIAPPTGSVAPPVKAATPIAVDEHARRREPVEAEQRRHDGEGAPDENGIAVSLARTRDRQRDGAGVATPAPTATPPKWIQPSMRTLSRPTKCRSAAGTIAANAAAARSGMRVGTD